MSLEIVMWIATVLSIFMYVPQVLKIIKTKNVVSLSKITFLFIWFATCNYTLSLSTVSAGGYWTNVIILLLMQPIFWYVFESNKKLFFIILIFSALVGSSSLYLYFKNPKFSDVLQYIFAINSAGILTCAFWPQTFLIIKNKKIESYSLVMGLTTMIANILWISYWGQMISINDPSSKFFTAIISLVGSTSVVLSQFFVFSIYLMSRKKL